MDTSAIETIARITARERLLIASSRGATMDGSPDKVAALADIMRALDRLGTTYAVVGGVAVGIRSGVPRATLDIDVAVPSAVKGPLWHLECRNVHLGALASRLAGVPSHHPASAQEGRK